MWAEAIASAHIQQQSSMQNLVSHTIEQIYDTLSYRLL